MNNKRVLFIHEQAFVRRKGLGPGDARSDRRRSGAPRPDAGQGRRAPEEPAVAAQEEPALARRHRRQCLPLAAPRHEPAPLHLAAEEPGAGTEPGAGAPSNSKLSCEKYIQTFLPYTTFPQGTRNID